MHPSTFNSSLYFIFYYIKLLEWDEILVFYFKFWATIEINTKNKQNIIRIILFNNDKSVHSIFIIGISLKTLRSYVDVIAIS